MSGGKRKGTNPIGANNSASEAGNEADSLEFIEKTRLRLIERRRFEMVSRLKEVEEQRRVTTASRNRWRDQLKVRRTELLAYFVDKKILRETIRHHPEILIENVKFANQPNSEGLLANRLKESLDKLTEDKTDGEGTYSMNDPNHRLSGSHDIFAMKEDLLPLSIGGDNDCESIINKLLISSSHPSQAVQFLQNSVTFNLAVNKRMRDYRRSSSIERSDNGIIIRSPKESFGCIVTADSPSNFNSPPDPVDLSSKSSRPSIYNQLDDEEVTAMVMSLACGAYRPSKDKSNSSSNFSGVDHLDLWEPRRILKTTGVMTRIMGSFAPSATATRETRGFSKAPIPSAPIGSNLGFSSPIPSSFARRMHSNSFQNLAELTTSTPATAVEMKGPKNSVHCSLVDDAFLIGPSDQSILKLIKARSLQQKTHTGVEVHCLDPHIIYRTECDNPDMLGLLPSYCYPRYFAVSSIVCV